MGEHRPYKPRVTGSSPVPPTIFIDNLLRGVGQFWLERPLFHDGKIAESSSKLNDITLWGCSSVWLERPVFHDGKIAKSSPIPN